ncbi:uncharacterized protein LOC129758782 [Uranotaenia lowii]|uniref:uncharacterized protein LOC129758782 n=1 Tax=Uranotaenia lowii TaxID=190385 RepID=UPI00247864BA|nr:uncharacterized protein LOC129758782 [Uranotaenia lowii]
MFAKVIMICALAIACVSAKPLFQYSAYSAPLVASPAVAVASPYSAAYTAPVAAAAYTAAAPFGAAYTTDFYGSAYPYAAAYGSYLL